MLKAVFVTIASLSVAFVSCGGSAIEVEAARPGKRDIENALTTNGRVEATGAVAVHADRGGRVERVLVRRGEAVERGQDLLRLADAGQAEALSVARARLAAARARLAVLDAGPSPSLKAQLLAERSKLVSARERAAADIERLERLVRRNAAPRAELEAKTASLRDLDLDLESLNARIAPPLHGGRRQELEAGVAEAESAREQAQAVFDGLLLRVPARGVVYALPVAAGDYLPPGGLAARIGSVRPARVRMFVDEPDLGRVGLGARATVTADAYPNRQWDCEVDRLASEVIERGARRIGEFECAIENTDGLLLPNLAVGVRIVTDRVRSALSIPRSAVQRSGGRSLVWTLEDGRAARREIRTGVEGPAHVEVLDGLTESAVVLVPRDQAIAQGRRVSATLLGGDK